MPGNNMPPGSYHISEENNEEFLKLYYKRVFIDKIPTHMTEAPDLKGISPVKIDVDLKYNFPKLKRLYTDNELKKLIRYHYEELERWLLPLTEEQRLCFVFEKTKPILAKKKLVQNKVSLKIKMEFIL